VDLTPSEAERFCGRPDIPGYRDDRCWEGTDFVQPPEPRSVPEQGLRPPGGGS